jgi:hypothetical protein
MKFDEIILMSQEHIRDLGTLEANSHWIFKR